MSVVVSSATVALGRREVLSQADAHFPSGCISAIIGPSGSGKSTLLGAISGAIALKEGLITAEGGIEWIVQSTPLLNRRKAIDNVMASALFDGLSPDRALLKGLRAMQAVGVMVLAREKTYKLSGGEKQRLAVARAIASKAQVILADEPTASLDAKSREKVCDALIEASTQGVAVIVATHDPYVAMRCDLVYSLSEGKLSPEER